MTEKRDQLFTAIRNAQSLAERNSIATEWLRDIASDSVVLSKQFPTDCAAFFSAVVYSADDAATAELLGCAIRGAYILGRVSKH